MAVQAIRALSIQAELETFDYGNGFYTPHRVHSALGRKHPVAFERKAI